MRSQILIIDDEPQIVRLLRNALNDTSNQADLGVDVLEATTGREGVDLAAAECPALIVLDLGLPDMPGIEVCREIRQWSVAPIFVLSARHEASEKVALLDAGADDYLTKPFNTKEFLARVRAQLRRASAAPPGRHTVVITAGDVAIDLQRRRVERHGEVVHLTPTEWGLLRTLVTHPGQTLTHGQLFAAVWGDTRGDAQQYLRVYVGHLRRKIESDPVRPRYIQTEPGVGYRFEPDAETAVVNS